MNGNGNLIWMGMFRNGGRYCPVIVRIEYLQYMLLYYLPRRKIPVRPGLESGHRWRGGHDRGQGFLVGLAADWIQRVHSTGGDPGGQFVLVLRSTRDCNSNRARIVEGWGRLQTGELFDTLGSSDGRCCFIYYIYYYRGKEQYTGHRIVGD